MKNRCLSAAAAAFLLCLAACSPVNENVSDTQSGTAVYISPKSEEDDSNSDFVRSTLTDEEITAYDRLVEAVGNYDGTIVFPESFDREKMRKIFALVYTQENRIFWLDSKFYCDEETKTINLFYRYDKEKSDDMRVALEMKAGEIISSVPEGSSDYDKILAFHDAIILGCDFAKDGEYSNTAYGAIVDGSAQCEGYAFALAYLCSAAGIENYVVQGSNSEGASHAWNKVYADGDWYNVDCTWDDPILKYENPDYIRHDYFFVSDAEINNKTHFPDTSLFEPIECTKSDGNYFVRSGLMFSAADDGISRLSEEIRSAVPNGNHEVEIRFTAEEAYKQASAQLFDNNGLKQIIEDLNGNYGLKIQSAHKNVNDSIYVIHISLIY